MDLGSIPVGVRAFESHPPQWYPAFKESILKVFKIGWDEEKYHSLTFNRWRISGYMGLNIFLVIHVIRVIQNVR